MDVETTQVELDLSHGKVYSSLDGGGLMPPMLDDNEESS